MAELAQQLQAMLQQGSARLKQPVPLPHLGTTQIYTHLDFQHLARVYDGAHPRAKRKG